MKVYLVSTGCYSDWTVRGLFSTRELADKCVEMLRLAHDDAHDDANDVEEWLVDDLADRVKRGMQVWMVWSEGMTVEVDTLRAYDSDLRSDDAVGVVKVFCVGQPHAAMRVIVEARDMDHAIKIAADKFREFVATNQPAQGPFGSNA